MTSILNWKRALCSLSALLLFAYLVSSLPFRSPDQEVQQDQDQEPRHRSPFPKTPSKMSIQPSTDLDISISSQSSSNHIQLQKQSSSSSSTYSLPLHVTITNTADHPISFLKWNSPLDSKAGLLGVFHITSTSTGEEVALDTLKFNRKLPPPVEDVVEIPAGGKVEHDAEIPRANLGGESGSYKVRAEGRWQAVWRGTVDEVTAEAKLDSVGSEKPGNFKSNEIDVTVA